MIPWCFFLFFFKFMLTCKKRKNTKKKKNIQPRLINFLFFLLFFAFVRVANTIFFFIQKVNHFALILLPTARKYS